MRQNVKEDRQEIISIEEYLRKRSVIRAKESIRKNSGASQKKLSGKAIELAELMYI